jgi:uncharacterized membrane protein YqjE
VAEASRPRPLADVLLEIKEELVSFVETRLYLCQTEFKETVDSMKGWLPLAITAAVLLGTAYLLLTAMIVSLVSSLFVNNQFRWPIAFSVVGGVEALAGIIAVVKIRNAFRKRGSFPKKTLEILKADGRWLKDGVKRAS